MRHRHNEARLRECARHLLCAAGALFLVVAAAPPATAATATGCCQAVPLWAGALNSEVLTTDASIVTTDVPPGWYSDFSTPYYYLPQSAPIKLSATLGGDVTTAKSRGRYWWELECFSPEYRQSTERKWVDVPAGPSDPMSPLVPLASVSGSLSTGNCAHGYIWFSYDEGDDAYAEATNFEFEAVPADQLPPPSGSVQVWRWVTSDEAAYVTRTGKYPVPPSVTAGLYFEKTKEYALAVSYLFKGYQLVQGTMELADLVDEISNDSPELFGFFFPTKAIGSGTSFHVVQ